jgi:hypothetical protein
MALITGIGDAVVLERFAREVYGYPDNPYLYWDEPVELPRKVVARYRARRARRVPEPPALPLHDEGAGL